MLETNQTNGPMTSNDLKEGPISWEEAAAFDEEYSYVLEREFVDCELYVDSHYVIRWKKNPEREKEIMKMYGAKDLNDLFGRGGVSKNDPIIRELYKVIGYSLYGFWEIFYWEVNNPRQVEYQGRMPDEQYAWLRLADA